MLEYSKFDKEETTTRYTRYVNYFQHLWFWSLFLEGFILPAESLLATINPRATYRQQAL